MSLSLSFSLFLSLSVSLSVSISLSVYLSFFPRKESIINNSQVSYIYHHQFASELQPVAFGVSFNLNLNRNLFVLFSTERGKRDLEN